MCHTTIPEQMPLTTADGSMGAPGAPSLDANGMPTGAQPTGAGAADALSQSVAAGNPTSASVNMPTGFGRAMELLTGGALDPTGGADAPGMGPRGTTTKFGMLMQVLRPALEGGLIGWAGGKGHPQGGFGAANDYFARQRAYQMQRLMLQRQLFNDQFKNLLDYARTQHTLQQPNFNGRGVAPIKGRDANGNLIYMRPNPYTGTYEPVQGITPDQPDNSKLEMTDSGLVSVNPRTASATRVTIPTTPPGQAARMDAQPGPDGNAPTSIPARLPSQFDSGSPRRPGSANQSPSGIAASAGAIPLHAPNFGKPKPTIRASRNAAGVETDHMIDTDPDSPTFGQDLGTVGTSRAPLPDRAGNRENARADQKADDAARAEQYAGAALGANGNDPDKAITYLNGLRMPDAKSTKDFNRLLPLIRKSITDRTKSRKPNSRNALGLSDQQLNELLSPTGQQDQEQP